MLLTYMGSYKIPPWIFSATIYIYKGVWILRRRGGHGTDITLLMLEKIEMTYRFQCISKRDHPCLTTVWI